MLCPLTFLCTDLGTSLKITDRTLILYLFEEEEAHRGIPDFRGIGKYHRRRRDTVGNSVHRQEIAGTRRKNQNWVFYVPLIIENDIYRSGIKS